MKIISYVAYLYALYLGAGWQDTFDTRCCHNALLQGKRCDNWFTVAVICAALSLLRCKSWREEAGIAIRYLVAGVLPFVVINCVYLLYGLQQRGYLP